MTRRLPANPFRRLTQRWYLLVSLFFAFLGGLGAVWWLADLTQNKLTWVVQPVTGGQTLNGEYEVKTAIVFWVLFGAILLILLALVCCIELFLSRKDVRAIDQMRVNYNDMLDCARAVTHAMYANPRQRVDIKSARVVNTIMLNGVTKVSREYKIECVDSPVHRLEVSIDADAQHSALPGHRAVPFHARDMDTGAKLHWIPTTDQPTAKTFVVFFAEMQPGSVKNIHIEFEWSGFAARLQSEGSTEFWWSHKAATPGNRPSLEHIWIFENGFEPITIEQIGEDPGDPKVESSTDKGCQTFTYKHAQSRADQEDLRFRVAKTPVASAADFPAG